MAWITSLVDTYRGVRNVSIGVYEPPSRLFPSLSMLFFDEHYLFLMNIATRPPGQYRDIKVSSKEVVSIMDSLYEQMWQAATIVLDTGAVQESQLSQFLTRMRATTS